jgi:hypothetical protein
MALRRILDAVAQGGPDTHYLTPVPLNGSVAAGNAAPFCPVDARLSVAPNAPTVETVNVTTKSQLLVTFSDSATRPQHDAHATGALARVDRESRQARARADGGAVIAESTERDALTGQVRHRQCLGHPTAVADYDVPEGKWRRGERERPRPGVGHEQGGHPERGPGRAGHHNVERGPGQARRARLRRLERHEKNTALRSREHRTRATTAPRRLRA